MQKRSVPENVAERAEYKFARRGCFKDKRHPRPRGISHNSNLNIRYTRTYIRYPWPSPLYIKANPLDKNERSQLLIIEPIHQKSQYDRCLSVRTKFPLCVWIILRIKFPISPLAPSPFVSIVSHEKENCILPRVIILNRIYHPRYSIRIKVLYITSGVVAVNKFFIQLPRFSRIYTLTRIWSVNNA